MDFIPCPSCQEFNPPDSLKCQKCGEAIPAVAEVAPAAAAVASAAAPATGGPPAPAHPEAAAPPSAPELPSAVAEKARALEDRLKANPALKALYLQLSQLYAEAGRKDLAVDALERALKVDPTNVYVKHRLSLLTQPPGKLAPLPPPPVWAVRAPAPRPRPRSRRVTVLVAAGIATVAVGVGLKLWLFPSTRLLVSGPYDAHSPRWSPRGDRFAFIADPGGQPALSVYDVKRRAVREVAKLAYAWGDSFAWSSDGRRLAYVAAGQEGLWGEAVFIVDVEGGQPTRLASGSHPSWMRDGSVAMVCAPEYRSVPSGSDEEEGYAAVAEAPAGICVASVADGTVRRLQQLSPERLVASPNDDVLVLQVAAAQGAPPLPSQPSPEHPDGELVALADAAIANKPVNVLQGSQGLSGALEARKYDRKGDDPGLIGASDLLLASLDGSPPVPLTQDGRSSSPAWSSDGRILYVHQPEGAARAEIWSMSPDGSDKRPLFRSPMEIWNPEAVALAPDRRRLVFTARVPGVDAGVAKIMTGEEPVDLFVADVRSSSLRRLENKHSFKQRFALSPDGRRIVYEYVGKKSGKSELWMMSL